MVGTITREVKREGQKKAKRHNPQEVEKGKELVPLMVGKYFTHSPSNVACMQIVKYNNNGRSKTNIACQCNLPFYMLKHVEEQY